jgi:hypothetical protein
VNTGDGYIYSRADRIVGIALIIVGVLLMLRGLI